MLVKMINPLTGHSIEKGEYGVIDICSRNLKDLCYVKFLNGQFACVYPTELEVVFVHRIFNTTIH